MGTCTDGRLLLTQARRAALLERETSLQRWAVKLDLEAARHATAAKTLQQQLGKVRAACPIVSCRAT